MFRVIFDRARSILAGLQFHRHRMSKLSRFTLTILLLFAMDQSRSARAQDMSSVERGKYIVEGVAMCGRCHTPHVKGETVRSQWLMGAPIQIDPTSPERSAMRAPRIAGAPPGTDTEFITLLTTGIARTHVPPLWPMPSFRMTRKDAESVLAYLKSLR
jgi:mono/diheme cytochrome c family protein